MAALAAVTNSNNGIATSTGQSQSGASASSSAVAILSQAPQGAVSKSSDTAIATTQATLLRELEEVERELDSPNSYFYQTLKAPEDMQVLKKALERIMSFPEGATLFTMYTTIQSRLACLEETIHQMRERVEQRQASATIEGIVYDLGSMREQLHVYITQHGFIGARINPIQVHVQRLLATRDRLRASLGTAAVAAAALPAAASSARKTS